MSRRERIRRWRYFFGIIADAELSARQRVAAAVQAADERAGERVLVAINGATADMLTGLRMLYGATPAPRVAQLPDVDDECPMCGAAVVVPGEMRAVARIAAAQISRADAWYAVRAGVCGHRPEQ